MTIDRREPIHSPQKPAAHELASFLPLSGNITGRWASYDEKETASLLNPAPGDDGHPQRPVLKVLGLGGGGCNAINRMIELGMGGVEFIAANTDHQALKNCLAPVTIQLGPTSTRGLGAGGNPNVGRVAAEESYAEIANALSGADMVFLTAGMGGGTGTGSIAVAARIARSIGAVTIAIVTTPFSFEMGRRQKNASEGLAALRPHTDTLIAIPNDRLLMLAGKTTPVEMAFRMADDVLRQAVQGITEIITEPGMVNVDFANVRHLMKLGGGALMAIGQGEGENKLQQAIDQALSHPLLGSIPLEDAAGVLVNITAGLDLTLFEFNQALSQLQRQANPNAEIVMGVINDERMSKRAQAILIVTGLGATSLEEAMQSAKGANINDIPVASTVPEPNTRRITPSVPQPRSEMPETTRLHADTYGQSDRLDIPAFLRRNR